MPNVDPYELEKFSAQADSWWDLDGPMRTLHAINPCRMSFITTCVTLKNKKVLDIGCGGGILSEALAQQGANVLGIDLADDMIAIAQAHAQQNGLSIEYQCLSAESLVKQKAHQFDVITCLELLEHVPKPEEIIHACAQLVKPGGHLFFSTLNRTWQAYAFAILGGEYFLRLLPRGTHDWGKFIKPAELAHWLRNSHIDLKQLSGMRYHPLTQTCQLTSNVNVNYLAHCTVDQTSG